MTILGMVGLLAAIRSSMAPSPKKSVEIKNKLPISTSPDQAMGQSENIIGGLPVTSSNNQSIITEPTPRAPSRESDDEEVAQRELKDMPSSQLNSEVSATSSNKKDLATTTPKNNYIIPGKAAAQTSLPGKDNNPQWRSYGTLQVDWDNLRPLDGGNIVARAVNEKGAQFYIAINCRSSNLNNTGAKLQWGTWHSPQKDHEELLIRDICKK